MPKELFEDCIASPGLLPYNRLMGDVQLHFHHWCDYNGVAFSIELRKWFTVYLKKLLQTSFKIQVLVCNYEV